MSRDTNLLDTMMCKTIHSIYMCKTQYANQWRFVSVTHHFKGFFGGYLHNRSHMVLPETRGLVRPLHLTLSIFS